MNPLGNTNTLAQLLQGYLPPQQEQSTIQQPQAPVQTQSYNGIKVYEVRKKEELNYIKPDETGQKQVIICDEDDTVYISRKNYLTEKPERKEYIFKENVVYPQNNDGTNESIQKIAEALVAVVDRLSLMQAGLSTLQNEITEIKNSEPIIIEKEVIKQIEVVGSPETKPKTSARAKKTKEE